MSSNYRSILNAQGSSFASTNSFTFDGSTDYIQTNSTYSELDGQSKASFSFWIKPPSTIVDLQVISSVIRNATQSNHQFQIRLATNATVQISMDTDSKYIRASSTPLNLNAWNHVLFCFDTTQGSASNRGRVFINGVNATSATTISSTFKTSTGFLRIGENENGHYNNFEGILDEFAIWSGTDLRNQSDVDTIYNGGIPTNLNDNGLTAPTTWYRMGEEANYTGRNWDLIDQGSGGNNGFSDTLPAPPAQPSTDVPT